MGKTTFSHDGHSLNMKRFFKLKWILSGAAVLLLLVYFAIPDSAATGDNLKYERLLSDMDWVNRYSRFQKSWPRWVVDVLRLQNRGTLAWMNADARARELLASGYLITNSILITNFPTGLTNRNGEWKELARRVRTLESQRIFWTFTMRSNNYVFMCRPKDWPRVKQLAETP